jgi:hypothetical protein
MVRATMSVDPPGGNGTTNMMLRSGHAALAGDAIVSSIAPAPIRMADRRVRLAVIGLSSLDMFLLVDLIARGAPRIDAHRAWIPPPPVMEGAHIRLPCIGGGHRNALAMRLKSPVKHRFRQRMDRC